MVRFTHDGLEVWYATPDAPAPEGAGQPRQGISLTVGAKPASPSNTVSVRYRVDGRGAVETLPARLVANDYANRAQYFRADFPTFWSGDLVEYVPIVASAGRRVPDLATASTFPSSFRLAGPPAERAASPPARSAAAGVAFPARLEHLVNVRVQLAKQGEVVGDTPAGYVVNWPPAGGRLDGPAFHATVMPGGEHETIVRPDGVGILSVRVTVQTDDQALISLRYTGVVDYGLDGLARLRAGQWPTAMPVRTAVRLLTEHRQYAWLNRLQCVGIGQVVPSQLLYAYDLYALR